MWGRAAAHDDTLGQRLAGYMFPGQWLTQERSGLGLSDAGNRVVGQGLGSRGKQRGMKDLNLNVVQTL